MKDLIDTQLIKLTLYPCLDDPIELIKNQNCN